MLRNRFQSTLFPLTEIAPETPTWSVASFSLAVLVDDCGHDHAIRPLARAVKQALENVKARRDPAMHLASFDILGGAFDEFYFVAIPENIPASVLGMIERKLIELPSFARLKRSQPANDSRLRPFGFYEAGSIWVLETPSLRGETAFGGQGVAVRQRLASSVGNAFQMTFDYAL